MNIQLRKIEEKDLELLRQWRMKDNVTKYMLTDPIITKESQLSWYNEIIHDNSRMDYVIECDNVRIGYYGITNINYEYSSCEIGFYIGEDEYRGKGIFKKVQEIVENIVFYELKLKRIIINALEINPIIKSYKKNGYVENESNYNYINKNNINYKAINMYKQI